MFWVFFYFNHKICYEITIIYNTETHFFKLEYLMFFIEFVTFGIILCYLKWK